MTDETASMDISLNSQPLEQHQAFTSRLAEVVKTVSGEAHDAAGLQRDGLNQKLGFADLARHQAT
jgi:hypothetical protein